MSENAIQDMYALSPMQQGMLFHSLYAPEAGMYVEQLNVVMRGELDLRAFEQAWQHIIKRHPVLRTAFIWNETDKPLQVVYEQVESPITYFDWRGWEPDMQKAELEKVLQADRARGFDLSEAPLMRLNCFFLSADTYQLVWSHHHILLDGWSLAIVFQELFACYEAFARGETAIRLKPLRPYRDYINWLRRQSKKHAEEFWRNQLRGFTSPTVLGIDRGAVPTKIGRAHV